MTTLPSYTLFALALAFSVHSPCIAQNPSTPLNSPEASASRVFQAFVDGHANVRDTELKALALELETTGEQPWLQAALSLCNSNPANPFSHSPNSQDLCNALSLISKLPDNIPSTHLKPIHRAIFNWLYFRGNIPSLNLGPLSQSLTPSPIPPSKPWTTSKKHRECSNLQLTIEKNAPALADNLVKSYESNQWLQYLSTQNNILTFVLANQVRFSNLPLHDAEQTLQAHTLASSMLQAKHTLQHQQNSSDFKKLRSQTTSWLQQCQPSSSCQQIRLQALSPSFWIPSNNPSSNTPKSWRMVAPDHTLALNTTISCLLNPNTALQIQDKPGHCPGECQKPDPLGSAAGLLGRNPFSFTPHHCR